MPGGIFLISCIRSSLSGVSVIVVNNNYCEAEAALATTKCENCPENKPGMTISIIKPS